MFMEQVETECPGLESFVWRGKAGGEVRWERKDGAWDIIMVPMRNFDAEGAKLLAVFALLRH